MTKVEETSAHQYTFEELLEKDGRLVYTNVGISMMPLLRQYRDLIEIRKKSPEERCRKYDTVLYKRGSKYILHRIVKVRPNDYVIVGDNCIWREHGVTDDQILGIMTRVIRDGKTITMDDKRYLLYVHLWCGTYHVRAVVLYCKAVLYNIARKMIKLLGVADGSKKES